MVWRCASHDPAHWSSTTGSTAMARATTAATAIFAARNIVSILPHMGIRLRCGASSRVRLLPKDVNDVFRSLSLPRGDGWGHSSWHLRVIVYAEPEALRCTGGFSTLECLSRERGRGMRKPDEDLRSRSLGTGPCSYAWSGWPNTGTPCTIELASERCVTLVML
jgi:hypothetical protein